MAELEATRLARLPPIEIVLAFHRHLFAKLIEASFGQTVASYDAEPLPKPLLFSYKGTECGPFDHLHMETRVVAATSPALAHLSARSEVSPALSVRLQKSQVVNEGATTTLVEVTYRHWRLDEAISPDSPPDITANLIPELFSVQIDNSFTPGNSNFSPTHHVYCGPVGLMEVGGVYDDSRNYLAQFAAGVLSDAAVVLS